MKSPRLSHRTLRWILGSVMALAAIGGGWWWLNRPLEYHEVGRYPVVSVTARASSRGFLLKEGANRFVLRDWLTGQPVWSVTSALPDASCMAEDNFFQNTIGLSEDGSQLTVATVVRRQLIIQFWQNSQPTGELSVPLPDLGDSTEARSNMVGVQCISAADGRHYLRLEPRQQTENPISYLYVFDGVRLVAKGTAPGWSYVSHDGSIHVWHYEKFQRVETEYRCMIEGSRLRLAEGQPVTQPAVMTTITNTTQNGRYQVQAPKSIRENVRMLDRQSQQFWEKAAIRDTDHGVLPTEDGGGFFTWKTEELDSSPVGWVVVHGLPPLANHIPDKKYIFLYRRDANKPVRVLANAYYGTAPSSDYIVASPDGRSLGIAHELSEKEPFIEQLKKQIVGKQQWEYRLYRY